jgi:hypothetical protein
MPRYKPWYGYDDAENVLFVSVHGYGPRARELEYAMPAAAFYPGTGVTKIPDLAPPSPLRPNVTGYDDEEITDSHKRIFAEMTATPEKESNKEDEDSVNDTILSPENLANVGKDLKTTSENDVTNNDNKDYEFPGDESDDEIVDGTEASSSADGIDMDGGDTRLETLRQTFYGGIGKGAGPAAKDGMKPLIMDIGVNLPSENAPIGQYRHQWRNYFRDEIFPRIAEFNPDMIFISAGMLPLYTV